MMRKMEWLAKLVAAGLILSFLSIWTTGYIVTSYVETLLKQFNLPLEVPPMAMSGVWGKLWGADPLVTTDLVEKEQTVPVIADELDTSSEDQNDTETPAAVDAFGQENDPPLTDIGIGGGTQAGGSAAPETGEVQEGIAGTDDPETAMTTEALTEVKEQMSTQDKEDLFGLLMSKLPQESWQTISQYIEDGLTEQELTAIQQIMAQHLDKTEYNQMMDILKKY
ncbi:hypothetical protein BK133_21025 [Paenibacillus sp. FSL H8-0548]|uniref:hypothetical protein n=1 Tax=Paenibacillus sp. FSL H8-0548 TaxID=1920422 RepID=UPI00097AF279|nr:hypothetical protein [Paenibacillus sp. FSL H8-0548]OMF25807.1 hypothetical protein BK133_21025 [Paenibacillus sp. FSL H8-0548]